jgi:hypothetical protein
MSFAPDVLLSVTAGNPIGFPVPAINPPDPPAEGETIVIPIPDDVYEVDSFSFDLTYQLYTQEIAGETITQTNVNTEIEFISYSSGEITGLSAIKIDDQTIRISGAISDAFNDAFYRFVMPDYSVKTLPASTTEEYLALIEWSIPSIRIKDFTHTVICKVTNLEDNTFEERTNTFPQTVYWKLEPALAQFRNLLAKGKI